MPRHVGQRRQPGEKPEASVAELAVAVPGPPRNMKERVAQAWAWAKEHPWKAALYALPYMILLPLVAAAFMLLKRGGRAGREVELSRAALEEQDRQLVEDMTSEIEEIEEAGREEVFAAEKTSRQRRLRATDQVVDERDDLAADSRALIEALRNDGRKDKGQ